MEVLSAIIEYGNFNITSIEDLKILFENERISRYYRMWLWAKFIRVEKDA